MTATNVLADTSGSRPAAPPVPTAAAHPAGPEGPAGRRPGGAGAGEHVRPGQHGRARPTHVARANRRRSRSGAFEPQALARVFTHLYLEVECGRRPARQLAALMDPDLQARLEPGWVRLDQPLGRIRHVHATMHDGRIQAVAVVQRGRRAGALALELARIAGRWYVTAAVRPEDGPLPPVDPTVLPAGEIEDGLDELGDLGLGEDGGGFDGALAVPVRAWAA